MICKPHPNGKELYFLLQNNLCTCKYLLCDSDRSCVVLIFSCFFTLWKFLVLTPPPPPPPLPLPPQNFLDPPWGEWIFSGATPLHNKGFFLKTLKFTLEFIFSLKRISFQRKTYTGTHIVFVQNQSKLHH